MSVCRRRRCRYAGPMRLNLAVIGAAAAAALVSVAVILRPGAGAPLAGVSHVLAGPGIADSEISNPSGIGSVRYGRDVRPILSDRCFLCHGPDREKQQADLRLDLREGAVAARGDHGPAIVPGDPGASELWRRIESHDPEEVMPPADSTKKPLSAEERAIVRRWIEEGAEYEPHWAFEAPIHMDAGPPDLAVARLGDPLAQRGHALRPVHHRAARRRPAAGRDAGPEDRERLQPQPRHHRRRRRDRRGVPRRIRRRTAWSTTQHRLPRPDARLRALPRPQVRSDHAGRLLQHVRVLQLERGAGLYSQSPDANRALEPFIEVPSASAGARAMAGREIADAVGERRELERDPPEEDAQREAFLAGLARTATGVVGRRPGTGRRRGERRRRRRSTRAARRLGARQRREPRSTTRGDDRRRGGACGSAAALEALPDPSLPARAASAARPTATRC